MDDKTTNPFDEVSEFTYKKNRQIEDLKKLHPELSNFWVRLEGRKSGLSDGTIEKYISNLKTLV